MKMSWTKYILAVALAINRQGLPADGMPSGILVQPPSNIVLIEGQSAKLECVFDGPAQDCEWIKDDCCLLELDNRFRLSGDIELGDCSLEVSLVKKSDEGHWQCVSLQNGTKKSRNTRVSIQSNETVGQLNFLKQPMDKGVVQYDHTILECQFNGPAPLCFWMKDSDTISIEGKYKYVGDKHRGYCALNITSVDNEDDGSWQCGYPRTKGTTALKSPVANVSIEVPPEDPVIVYNGIKLNDGDTIYVERNEYVSTIWCYSENGKPAATLSWHVGDWATDLLQGSDNQVFDSNMYPSLKISRSRFWQPMSPSWNQKNLSCEAHHPLYDNTGKLARIRLVIAEIAYPQNDYQYG